MPHVSPWFPNAKLGIFVHWGLFRTMFAEDEAHPDWGMRGLPEEEYRRRVSLFTCNRFDMDEWATTFKRWGARYAVLTTRHAMGFALWDTKQDARSIVKMSPCGRDVVAEWTEGLRRAGIKVGLYFGHRDWNDPDFCAEMDNEGFQEEDPARRAAAWERYIVRRDAKMAELMENYGKVDYLWVDEDWGRTHEQLRCEQLAVLIEDRQPGIVMNNRFCHPYLGHVGTPEQRIPLYGEIGPREVCDTLADSPHWQYVEGERTYKRATDVVRFFIDAISTGCNYLINIGPKPDGSIPKVESDILDVLGAFCAKNAEAIYDTSAGIGREYYPGPSTRNGATLYLFAVDRPRGEIALRGVTNALVRATRLDTGEKLGIRGSGGRKGEAYTWLTVPEDREDLPVVYKLEYEGKRLELSQR